MTVPSQTCLQNISVKEAELIELFNRSVAVREMLIVLGKNTSDLDARIDDAAKGGADTIDMAWINAAGSDKAKVQDFLSRVRVWVKKYGHPSWDNGLCVVRWREFACFCNGAAKAYAAGDVAGLSGYLKQFEGSNVEVKPSLCDARAMEDDFYTQTLGATSRQGPSWWMWGGLLIVGTVLAWPVVFGRKGHVR